MEAFGGVTWDGHGRNNKKSTYALWTLTALLMTDMPPIKKKKSYANK